jgi:hypothetical protein
MELTFLSVDFISVKYKNNNKYVISVAYICMMLQVLYIKIALKLHFNLIV